MRHFFAVIVVALAGSALLAAQGAGGKVEVKGPHICCKQCINVVNKILGKVDGVSEVHPDNKTRSVTFTAKDESAAKAGLQALIAGGFFGKATLAGKEFAVAVATPAPGAKAEVVTVKDVHVCCGACQNAINKLFTGAKVSYEGKGPQKSVRIAGPDLDTGVVIEALRKAGFNGSAEK
jgi:copper chaperone CopZ